MMWSTTSNVFLLSTVMRNNESNVVCLVSARASLMIKAAISMHSLSVKPNWRIESRKMSERPGRMEL